MSGSMPLRYSKQEFGSWFSLWQDESHNADEVFDAYKSLPANSCGNAQ